MPEPQKVTESQNVTESQKVTEQRELTAANGNVWLIMGALLTLICGGLLFAMQWLQPPGVGFAGLVVVLVLYAAMVVIRFAGAAGKVRLRLLAAATILIVIAFFVFGGIVTASEWGSAS